MNNNMDAKEGMGAATWAMVLALIALMALLFAFLA